MFLTEDEVLMGYKNTDQNISARSLTLLIFAVGWGILWSTATRISDATAVHFSIKCFNTLKLLSSVKKHLQKVVCFIFFYLFTSI